MLSQKAEREGDQVDSIDRKLDRRRQIVTRRQHYRRDEPRAHQPKQGQLPTAGERGEQEAETGVVASRWADIACHRLGEKGQGQRE